MPVQLIAHDLPASGAGEGAPVAGEGAHVAGAAPAPIVDAAGAPVAGEGAHVAGAAPAPIVDAAHILAVAAAGVARPAAPHRARRVLSAAEAAKQAKQRDKAAKATLDAYVPLMMAQNKLQENRLMEMFTQQRTLEKPTEDPIFDARRNAAMNKQESDMMGVLMAEHRADLKRAVFGTAVKKTIKKP